MDQEKFNEYQQMAALTVLQIDLLATLAEDDSITAEQWRSQVRFAKEKTDKLIADPQERERCYRANCMLWSAVADGQVRSTSIG